MQVFKLQAYIEKRNSCVHRCCAVWCRAKEMNIMAARTDFKDELFSVIEVHADAYTL